nr:uncharacterized protein LOC117278680 [Nicotiana tomentosiformis]
MVGKDVVKDKGKGSKRKAKRDGDDVLSKKRKVHVDQKCSSSSDLKLVFGNIAPINVEQTRLELHDFVPVYEDKNEMYIDSRVVAEVNLRDDVDDFNTRPKKMLRSTPKIS